MLDHLEELPLSSQPKLLRLLAERRYAPLGGADRQADVRFVGIGVEDLEDRVRDGAFRADLYYRLEVVTFTLPALARRADRSARDLRPFSQRPRPSAGGEIIFG